jgi:thiosulfate dehydrogenase
VKSPNIVRNILWPFRKTTLFVLAFISLLLGPLLGVLILGPKKVLSLVAAVRGEGAQNSSRSVYVWQAPDTLAIPPGNAGKAIRYGRSLISNTSHYLGPKGKVMAISNGMNCQNCHLEAGTKLFGNNFSAVASTYPKFRARSGTIETIEKRINDCIERSLNGKSLPPESAELQAMAAYINWVGHTVKKGIVPMGVGLVDVPYLTTEANPVRGKTLYNSKCVTCHGVEGQGMLHIDGRRWINPPLWGDHSYNTGAGLYRLTRLAGYIKANMPLGASYNKPQLTDAEAWHIAAYINSRERPIKDVSGDWPEIATKPIDHPFGPYADSFSEKQHKFGPFIPIIEARKAK